MTNLSELKLLGSIKLALTDWHTYRDLLALLFLLVTTLSAIQVLSILKHDEQLQADYKDCMVSLTEEVNR